MTVKLDEEQKLLYAGIWLLKRIDLDPKEGGMVLSIHLPSELTPLDEVLQGLLVSEHVTINKKKAKYEITKAGYAYIGTLIDEAEGLIDEFEDAEMPEIVAELTRRGLDPFRARFLWGWYTDELDDLVLFQQRKGVVPVQPLWAYYLVSDEFWEHLAAELG